MTTDPPTQDDLAAGRELDALVAEKVMGWEPYSGGYYYGLNGRLLACVGRKDGYIGEFDKRWSPSTDISAAWEIVSRADEFDLWFNPDQNHWGCYISLPDGYAESWDATSAPLAICKAALAAVSDS